MKDAILAVDIGSASCRAVLFDFNKKGIVVGRSNYAFQQSRPGWMEQDPAAVFRGFRESVRQVSSDPRAKRYRVHCVNLSSVLHSLLPVDARGRPLAPLQTWADNRARLEDIEQNFSPRSLYRRTGCLFHPSYPFCKLLWMRQRQPALFKKAAKFISIKSYVLSRLFRRHVEDLCVASATGLLNLRSMVWDAEALALTALSDKRLPEVVSPYESVGGLSPEWARELGLPVGTRVIAGAGDGPLANVGGGSLSPGVAHVTIGTSAAVRATTDKPVFDLKRRLWCYRLDEDHFIFGGSSNNGGYVQKWAKNRFGFKGSDDELDRAIIRRLSSPNPLLFYPFLIGERSPHWEPRLRGGLLGFSTWQDRNNFVRAALEGVAFNLRIILEALRESLDSAEDVICAGGGMRSRTLARILAAVFRERIRIPKEIEASARGACVLGLKAVGAIQSLRQAEDPPEAFRTIEPRPEEARVYQELYEIYRRYLPLVRSLSVDLDRIKT